MDIDTEIQSNTTNSANWIHWTEPSHKTGICFIKNFHSSNYYNVILIIEKYHHNIPYWKSKEKSSFNSIDVEIALNEVKILNSLSRIALIVNFLNLKNIFKKTVSDMILNHDI